MIKFLTRLVRSYSKIIHDITISTQPEDITKFELLMLSRVIGPIMTLVALINIPLGQYWGLSLAKVSIYGVMLVLVAGLIMIVAERKRLSSTIKLHTISMLLVTILSMTYVTYYDILGVLFWFIVIIITFLANVSSSKILMIYLLCFTFIYFGYSLAMKLNHILVMDQYYYFALFLMLFFVMISSFVSNQIYRKIMEEKMAEYKNIAEKNDEITSLYEELIASEEELRIQNDKLHSYNQQISANKERLEYLAYNDTLTGLPNRKMLVEELNAMIVASDEKAPQTFAVVFIDLDNFKRINDTLGHSAGDILLVQASNRLLSMIHSNDLLSRLGGDELALIIRDSMSGEALLTYTQALCDAFERPFELEGLCTKITASFGISMFPSDGVTINDLLKAADTAMYKAKEVGKNNVQFYHKGMKDEILYRMGLESRLLNALRMHEFYLDYQPLFDTKSKKVIGFEALIRWKTANQIISPLEFIPFAEEIGLIGEIGEWVIQTACEKLKSLQMLGFTDITVAVNISAVQMNMNTFVETVKRIITQTEIDASKLEFEITESVFIQNKQSAVAKIIALKALGIRIAMDDFGTGYSSLSYLMDLPIDVLKIDRSFISAIEQGNTKQKLIGSIIDMVHTLDMKVVAEGIETKAQQSYLEDESCDRLQGFFLSRPLGEGQLSSFLQAHS